MQHIYNSTKSHIAAYQQWQRMQQQNDTPMHLRKKSINDIISHVNKMIAENKQVILLVDLNESVYKTKSGIHCRLKEIGLKDIKFHENPNEITTFRHGKHQIDNIYCTTHLHSYIRATGFLPFDAICTSDHRALYFDIDLSQYLRNQITRNQHQTRGITSNIPKNVQAYKSYVNKRLDEPEIKNKIKYITKKFNKNELSHEDLEMVNQLDQEFAKIRIEAEQNLPIKKRQRPPWSGKLHQAYLQTQFWKAHKVQMKYSQDKSERITTLQRMLESEICTIDIDLDRIEESLHDAKKWLKKCRKNAAQLRHEFLIEQAIASEISGNIAACKQIKQLIKIE